MAMPEPTRASCPCRVNCAAPLCYDNLSVGRHDGAVRACGKAWCFESRWRRATMARRLAWQVGWRASLLARPSGSACWPGHRCSSTQPTSKRRTLTGSRCSGRFLQGEGGLKTCPGILRCASRRFERGASPEVRKAPLMTRNRPRFTPCTERAHAESVEGCLSIRFAMRARCSRASRFTGRNL